jgi:hypothetical protein
VVERIGAIFQPPFPTPRVEPAGHTSVDDTRKMECGREEPCVDPFGAGPGTIPFADYLQALNLRARLEDPGLAGQAAPPGPQVQDRHPPETPEKPPRETSWPRIGDVPPVKPPPQPQPPIIRDVIRRPLGTGQMIDVVV